MAERTICITVGETPVMHNVIRTGFWNRFLTTLPEGVKVVVLVHPNKFNEYSEELRHEKVIVEPVEIKPRSAQYKFINSLARSVIHTHTNVWEIMRAYHEGGAGIFLTFFKRAHQAVFGRSNFYKRLIRKAFVKLKVESNLDALFASYKPEMVIAFSLTQSNFDVPVALSARQHNIPLIGMVRSWDNFTSHGLLRVVPDALYLQNKYLVEMADKHQAIDKDDTKLHVVGLPHYDAYLDDSLIIPKEEFCEQQRLDPHKKIILYGAMGDYLFPNEGTVADVFEDLIEEGKIAEPAQVLFRAHPRFESPLERIKNFKHVKGDRGATYSDTNLRNFEMKKDDMKHLINSFYHADVVVTGGSTIAIDAAALDKPTICVGFDGTAKNVDHWFSVARFYDCYTHFERLVEVGNTSIAFSPDELADKVNLFFENPSLNSDGRKRIKDELIEPFDGKAGERLADLMVKHYNEITHEHKT